MTFPIYLIPSRRLEMSGKIYVFDVLYNLRNSARFQPPKCLKSHFRDSRFQNFPGGACARTPLDGLAPSAFASPPPPKMKVWLRHCKQNIKRLREDMDLCSRVKNNLTRSLRSLVRYCFCHSNIKSISLRNRLISSIY